MRRLIGGPFLALVFLVAFARPADAWVWEFIEKLSGPSFSGPGIEWRLVCFNYADGGPETEVSNPGRQTGSVIAAVLPGCLFSKGPENRIRRVSINLTLGLMNDRADGLVYRDGDVVCDINLTSISPAVWMRVFKSVEVGGGGGVYWFKGPKFESFHRFWVEPVRLDWKPLEAFERVLFDHTGNDDTEWWRFLSLRAGYLISPQGFSPEDFGAVAGFEPSSRETLWKAGVYIDGEPILRWLRKKSM
jgi:hypothetical protein